MAKNATVKFNGRVTVHLIDEDDPIVRRPLNGERNFIIGPGQKIPVSGPWTITVKKKTPSPFSLKKAFFVLSGTGYVTVGSQQLAPQNGILTDVSNTIKLVGGKDRHTPTHRIKIEYFPQA